MIGHQNTHLKLHKRSCFERSFIVFIFVATLLCAGILPIAVAWSKTGNTYPFIVSVWLMVFKSLVFLSSLVMYRISQNAVREKPGACGVCHKTMTAVERLWLGLHLLIPAALYTFTDLLVFPIMKLTSPATCATLSQLKIVTVALMVVFVLGRHLSVIQWISVLHLSFAALLYKADDLFAMIAGGGGGGGVSTAAAENNLYGIGLILVKVVLVSVGSVYCDWSFKKKAGSHSLGFPEQQLWFSAWMVVFSVLYFFYADFSVVWSGERALFDGFGIKAIVTSILFASYGLLVSLFIKYLDSLTKLIMNLLALLITTALSVHYFGTILLPSQYFSIAFILIGAVFFKMGTITKKKKE